MDFEKIIGNILSMFSSSMFAKILSCSNMFLEFKACLSRFTTIMFHTKAVCLLSVLVNFYVAEMTQLPVLMHVCMCFTLDKIMYLHMYIHIPLYR